MHTTQALWVGIAFAWFMVMGIGGCPYDTRTVTNGPQRLFIHVTL